LWTLLSFQSVDITMVTSILEKNIFDKIYNDTLVTYK